MWSGFCRFLAGSLDLSQANRGCGSALGLADIVCSPRLLRRKRCWARAFRHSNYCRRNKSDLRFKPGPRFRAAVHYGTLGQLQA
jgi:hypothetical protein